MGISTGTLEPPDELGPDVFALFFTLLEDPEPPDGGRRSRAEPPELVSDPLTFPGEQGVPLQEAFGGQTGEVYRFVLHASSTSYTVTL